MKKNMLMIGLLAILVMTVSFASALGTIDSVEFNGVELDGSNSIAVSSSEVVPIWVQFTADEDATNVVLEVETRGRDGVSVSKELSDIEAGSTYPVLLNLKLTDTDDLSEEFTLYVTVSSNDDEAEESYDVAVKVQKESYDLEVLSVDFSSKVSSEDVFPVTVVAKNIGYNELDDTYVVVSIPALGVSARGYMGDLVTTAEDRNAEDEEDTMQHTVYLMIPSDAESGVYDLEVKVYNDDADVRTTRLVAVEGEDVEDSDAEDADDSVSTSVVVLTVILAIIFVVLLAVLVVLLTRKEKTIEEVETSYY